MKSTRFALAAGLASLVLATGARAQYRFTAVATFPVRLTHFLQSPAINEHAQIGFMGTDDTSPQGVAGLFLTRPGENRDGRRPPLTLVAAGFVDARSRSINEHGEAAFVRDAVFTTDGRHTVQIAPAPEDEETAYYAPAINDRGTVAFAADLDEDGNTALFIYTPGRGHHAGALAAVSDSTSGPLNFHSPPALDAADHVVFSAYAAGTLTTDVYLYTGGHVHPLYDHGIAPVVSPRGLVAFTRLDAQPGGTTILRGDEGGSPLVGIAGSAGPFTRVLADGINDGGRVVFRASLASPAGALALYVGDGRTITRVVGTGDRLFGRTVANLSPGSINAAGDLAFEAAFADGSAAVVKAEPVR